MKGVLPYRYVHDRVGSPQSIRPNELEIHVHLLLQTVLSSQRLLLGYLNWIELHLEIRRGFFTLERRSRDLGVPSVWGRLVTEVSRLAILISDGLASILWSYHLTLYRWFMHNDRREWSYGF